MSKKQLKTLADCDHIVTFLLVGVFTPKPLTSGFWESRKQQYSCSARSSCFDTRPLLAAGHTGKVTVRKRVWQEGGRSSPPVPVGKLSAYLVSLTRSPTGGEGRYSGDEVRGAHRDTHLGSRTRTARAIPAATSLSLDFTTPSCPCIEPAQDLGCQHAPWLSKQADLFTHQGPRSILSRALHPIPFASRIPLVVVPCSLLMDIQVWSQCLSIVSVP